MQKISLFLIAVLLFLTVPSLAYAGDSPPIVSPDDPRFGIVDITLNVDSDGERFVTVEYGSNVDPGTVVGKSLNTTLNPNGSITIGVDGTAMTYTLKAPLTVSDLKLVLEIESTSKDPSGDIDPGFTIPMPSPGPAFPFPPMPTPIEPPTPATTGSDGILTFTGNNYGPGEAPDFIDQLEREGLLEDDPFNPGDYTLTSDGTYEFFVTIGDDGLVGITIQRSDDTTISLSEPISPGALLFAAKFGLDLEDVMGISDEVLGMEGVTREGLTDESGNTADDRAEIDKILDRDGDNTTPGSIFGEGSLIESLINSIKDSGYYHMIDTIADWIIGILSSPEEPKPKPDNDSSDAGGHTIIPVGGGVFGGEVGRDGNVITNPSGAPEFNGPYGTSGSDDNTDLFNYDGPDSPNSPPIPPPPSPNKAPGGWEPFTPDGVTPIENPNDGGSDELTPEDGGEPIIIASGEESPIYGNTAPTPLAFILDPTDKIVHEPRWPDQCKGALEGNRHWLEETWWFAAYEWESVCMSIKMNGGYVFFMDFNGNDMVDGCNEMLCNAYWKQTYTVYDVLDQPLINQDNNKWFDSRDPLWQLAKAWRPTEETVHTMDQLGIQAITVRDEIKVKNDYMQKGAYTNDSIYTKDWRYDEARDAGWEPLNISLHEMRIVAWHPEGLVMKNGVILPTYDFLIGHWTNEKVEQSKDK